MKTNAMWWRSTTDHMWRVYFALLRTYSNIPDDLTSLSKAELNTYNICHSVCSALPVQSDIDILQMYYTTPKGMEIHNIEQYSLAHNVPVYIIWKAIRHANRAVIEELGLLDKR